MFPLSRLSSFIKQHALFDEDEQVLLAVSGGRDSVLMAHLFKAGGYKFGIAHCNFKMRDEESERDEEFTKELAARLNVPFFVTSFETTGYAQKNHISIQMAARDLRYQWLEQTRLDAGYDYIAVAHHHNDVMETMLLNLVRGTGIAGLHGIAPKKGRLIRPLLFLNRDQIDEIIQDSQITFREDRSNESAKYARNKIRLEVIPLLKELNPSLEETFEENRKRFADLEVLLEKQVAAIRQQLFKPAKNGDVEISLAELKSLEPRDTLLYGLFNQYGFSAQVLADLSRSWDAPPGKVFSSAGYDLILDRERVILSKRKTALPEILSIGDERIFLKWNNQRFASNIISADELDLKKEAAIAQIDMSKLKFPLTLRSWAPGDQFYPIGLKGRKKLSDFFIEQKVPLHRKKQIGILENGNGDIIWVAGLRLDDRYKITPGTKKVFIFEQFI